MLNFRKWTNFRYEKNHRRTIAQVMISMQQVNLYSFEMHQDE